MSEISFLDRVQAQVLETLKKMPALWFTEENAQNAWEMLVQLSTDDEPGMGIGYEIQSVLIGWIEGVVEKQPIDEVREYWIAETYPGSRFSCSDDYLNDPDAAVNGLAMVEISRDVAQEILGSVLSQAEDESRRREEAAEEEAWSEDEEDDDQ